MGSNLCRSFGKKIYTVPTKVKSLKALVFEPSHELHMLKDFSLNNGDIKNSYTSNLYLPDASFLFLCIFFFNMKKP